MQLVRQVRDGREAPVVRGLMLDRRRMLEEALETAPELPGSMRALQAAIVESDRTLEALLG
ncbi:MAG: hypothetical protein ABIQ86_00420 [Steroidobacteraceae bacterium]